MGDEINQIVASGENGSSGLAAWQTGLPERIIRMHSACPSMQAVTPWTGKGEKSFITKTHFPREVYYFLEGMSTQRMKGVATSLNSLHSLRLQYGVQRKE